MFSSLFRQISVSILRLETKESKGLRGIERYNGDYPLYIYTAPSEELSADFFSLDKSASSFSLTFNFASISRTHRKLSKNKIEIYVQMTPSYYLNSFVARTFATSSRTVLWEEKKWWVNNPTWKPNSYRYFFFSKVIVPQLDSPIGICFHRLQIYYRLTALVRLSLTLEVSSSVLISRVPISWCASQTLLPKHYLLKGQYWMYEEHTTYENENW